ncbi:MAG: site-2 protease family protein [Erysipelotrichaceae bacterium]
MHYLPKVRISFIWLPFIVLAYDHHSLLIVLFIFLMLAFHEAAHLIIAHYFKYEISSIMIYPFGIGAQIERIGWGNVYHEGAILISGPLMHLIFPCFFLLLKQMNLISNNFFDYLFNLNLSIMVFNLLPIYPLDGGRILSSFLHLLFPFKIAQNLTFAFSSLAICFFYCFFMKHTIASLLVMIFLFIQILIAFKQRKIMKRQFYLYRRYHPVTYALYAHEYQDIYRQRYNLIHYHQLWLKEEDWLAYYLDHNEKTKANHFTIL